MLPLAIPAIDAFEADIGGATGSLHHQDIAHHAIGANGQRTGIDQVLVRGYGADVELTQILLFGEGGKVDFLLLLPGCLFLEVAVEPRESH